MRYEKRQRSRAVGLCAVALAACSNGPTPYGPPDEPPPFAAPLRGRFVEVGSVDLGGDPSALQVHRPVWLAPDRIAVFEDYGLRARELRFVDSRIVEEPAQPLYTAGDLDGDGVLDCLRGRSVEWGCDPAVSTETPDYLNPVSLVADVDGDGLRDIVTSPRTDAPSEPPLRWFRQVTPRHFVIGDPPASQCVRNNLIRQRRDGTIVAVGWNCDDRPAAERTPAAIWHRHDGTRWHVLPDPIGYAPGSPMDFLELDAEGRCYLIAEHPGHVEVCVGRRVDVHPGFDWQRAAASREPMIPWTAAAIVVEGRTLYAIVHGQDAYGNDEHRRIGIGKSHVVVWERSGPGAWALVEGTGLEREGEWRWAAVGELAGSPGVIVGGYGEPARIYRYEAR